jgi:hypothetical protein
MIDDVSQLPTDQPSYGDSSYINRKRRISSLFVILLLLVKADDDERSHAR